MGMMIVRHKVKDYGQWRPMFDAHIEAQRAAGLINPRVYHSADSNKSGRREASRSGTVLTTFASYGEVAASRQAAIIRGLSNPNGGNVQLVDLAQQIMQVAQRTSAERSSVL